MERLTKQVKMTQHQYDMLFSAVSHMEYTHRDASDGEKMFIPEIRALNRLLKQWRDAE